jgi:choline transport protein
MSSTLQHPLSKRHFTEIDGLMTDSGALLTCILGDEVKDPARKVPLSMLLSVILNGIFQLAFVIVLLFTIGDPLTTLETPTGYPIIQILYGATGSNAGTIVLMTMLMFNGMVAMFSSLASVSRLTWAFARDKGLPFSGFLGHVSHTYTPYLERPLRHRLQVSPTLRVPLNSLGLITIIVALLMLINLGSETALFAILSLSSIALMLSYVLPIIFFALARFRHDRIPFGPFHLGRFGLPINIFAILYGVYIFIWLPFPPYLPVTAQNMNWSGPVLGGVIVFAVLDWVISGRKRFLVPSDLRSGDY